jgi:acyl dehydratase
MHSFEDFPLDAPQISRELALEEADMIAFAQSWDPQPLHTDKELSRTTELGLIASGVHLVAIAIRLSSELSDEPLAVVAGLGWDEIRFRAPARAGDRLRVRAQVIDKRLSQSRPGTGIVISQLELLNQDGTIVLTLKNSALVRCLGRT